MATNLFVYDALEAAVYAVLAFKDPAFLYLFILSIIFASVLLRQQGLFLGITTFHLLLRHYPLGMLQQLGLVPKPGNKFANPRKIELTL